MLKLISSSPDFYAHGGDAAVLLGEGFGCLCAKCKRDIAAPFGFEGMVIWCLYCGIDEGHIPAVESPWGHHRFTFGVTREEALEVGRFGELTE